MHLTDFRRMQRRVSRAKDAVAKNDAAGFTQSLNSTSDVKLVVVGMKSPEQVEDELLQLCVWIWSMKDYLKSLVVANGGTRQQIEDIVNKTDSLAIVADIANRDKHGTLTNSRTGDFAKLANVGYKINQAAFNSIAFCDSTVTLDVGKPDDANLYASVVFETGNRPALDAFQIIDDAIRVWEIHARSIAGA